ncbi:MAG: hypothetical protein ACJ718_02365 [Nitrososphaeraceae archaeon]
MREEPYTEEQLVQITQEIIECSYYPKDITQADMRDYLAKEENNEAVFNSVETLDVADERMKLGEQLFLDEITKRFDKNFEDYGIEPTMEMQLDANEEISMFRIKHFTSIVKELKAKFQVDKYRLHSTFIDKEALKIFTDDQIQNHVLSMWHLKDCIEKMEKELRDWEKEVLQRCDSSYK